MPKRMHSLRLHDELIEQIDRARGDVPRTRWIERALENALPAQKTATPQPRTDAQESRPRGYDRHGKVIR